MKIIKYIILTLVWILAFIVSIMPLNYQDIKIISYLCWFIMLFPYWFVINILIHELSKWFNSKLK